MAVPTAYLTSTKNTPAIFEAIRKAGVPRSFTYEFLKQLGFSSSSDRPIIPVMKAIGLLDEGGVPTESYRRYKDPSISKGELARAIRRGYGDVFALDSEAHTRGSTQLSGMLGRLSDKGESVTQKMAATFKALCSLADFDETGTPDNESRDVPRDEETTEPAARVEPPPPTSGPGVSKLSLRHDVHIHLPLSTDVAVYDAIFKAVKANLL
jgi:hypothetical protein